MISRKLINSLKQGQGIRSHHVLSSENKFIGQACEKRLNNLLFISCVSSSTCKETVDVSFLVSASHSNRKMIFMLKGTVELRGLESFALT